MSVRILHDSDEDRAVLYCSTTGLAFGPVIDGTTAEFADAVAENFLKHLADIGQQDPRTLHADTLTNTYVRWRAALPAAEVA